MSNNLAKELTADSIYKEIAHGDNEHRSWLKTKLDSLFSVRAKVQQGVLIPSPIMPQTEIVFYVVEITPYFGYEVVFAGTPVDCQEFAKDRFREPVGLYNHHVIQEDRIVHIVSKTMVDVIVQLTVEAGELGTSQRKDNALQ